MALPRQRSAPDPQVGKSLKTFNSFRVGLLDLRHMRDIPTVFRDYEVVKLFVKAGFQEIGTIAVLDRTDRETENKFFEDAAYNQGLRFQFFYASEQEAINWLLPKPEPQE